MTNINNWGRRLPFPTEAHKFLASNLRLGGYQHLFSALSLPEETFKGANKTFFPVLCGFFPLSPITNHHQQKMKQDLVTKPSKGPQSTTSNEEITKKSVGKHVNIKRGLPPQYYYADGDYKNDVDVCGTMTNMFNDGEYGFPSGTVEFQLPTKRTGDVNNLDVRYLSLVPGQVYMAEDLEKETASDTGNTNKGHTKGQPQVQGLVGLFNPGNLCYMHGVFVNLGNNPYLQDLFVSGRYKALFIRGGTYSNKL